MRRLFLFTLMLIFSAFVTQGVAQVLNDAEQLGAMSVGGSCNSSGGGYQMMQFTCKAGGSLNLAAIAPATAVTNVQCGAPNGALLNCYGQYQNIPRYSLQFSCASGKSWTQGDGSWTCPG